MGRTPVKRRAGTPGQPPLFCGVPEGCPVIMNINTKGEYTIDTPGRLRGQGAEAVRYTC